MTDTGRILATSDAEMGKNGPRPFGLRGKSGHTFVVVLTCGAATAFGLRLVWPDFPAQRHPPQKWEQALGAGLPKGEAAGKKSPRRSKIVGCDRLIHWILIGFLYNGKKIYLFEIPSAVQIPSSYPPCSFAYSVFLSDSGFLSGCTGAGFGIPSGCSPGELSASPRRFLSRGLAACNGCSAGDAGAARCTVPA